jgi:hypothetical protein
MAEATDTSKPSAPHVRRAPSGFLAWTGIALFVAAAALLIACALFGEPTP